MCSTGFRMLSWSFKRFSCTWGALVPKNTTWLSTPADWGSETAPKHQHYLLHMFSKPCFCTVLHSSSFPCFLLLWKKCLSRGSMGNRRNWNRVSQKYRFSHNEYERKLVHRWEISKEHPRLISLGSLPDSKLRRDIKVKKWQYIRTWCGASSTRQVIQQ